MTYITLLGLGVGGLRGCAILLLFTQFLQFTENSSKPWFCIVRAAMFAADREYAAHIAASSSPLLFAWHIQNKAIQAKWLGRPSHEWAMTVGESAPSSSSSHTSHTSQHPWCCSPVCHKYRTNVQNSPSADGVSSCFGFLLPLSCCNHLKMVFMCSCSTLSIPFLSVKASSPICPGHTVFCL